MDQQLQVFEGKVQSLNVGQVRHLFNREKKIGDAILLGLKEIARMAFRLHHRKSTYLRKIPADNVTDFS